MRALIALAALVPGVAMAQVQDAVVALGKQLAAGSKIEWSLRDTVHPTLGAIRYAYPRQTIFTPVGISRVSSRAWVSCEAGNGRIAIELANATAPDDPGGLQPRTVPRLVCNKPPLVDGKPTQEDLQGRWSINQMGDVLGRGFQPATLRACASITVLQEVALPKGWAKPTAPVVFDITPYGRELDVIFATCGETPVYAAAEAPVAAAPRPTPPPVTAPPASVPAPAPAPAPPTVETPKRAADGSWMSAHTTGSGRTNVRARPSTESNVVAQLPAGARILVQNAGGEWWRVKATAGGKLDGFIREDRLVFK